MVSNSNERSLTTSPAGPGLHPANAKCRGLSVTTVGVVRTHAVVATFLTVAGAVAGLLVASTSSGDRGLSVGGRRTCPEAGSAVVDSLRVTVDRRPDVSAELHAKVVDIDDGWRDSIGNTELASCVLANDAGGFDDPDWYRPGTSQFSGPDYHWDETRRRLEVSYGPTTIEVMSPEDVDLLTREPSIAPGSVRVWTEGTDLVVDVDACTQRPDAWACGSDSIITVEIGVPEDRSIDSVARPIPTKMEAANGVVWRTWEMRSAPTGVQVRVPLSPAERLLIKTRSSLLGSLEIRVGSLALGTFSWAFLWWNASNALLAFLAAIAISRHPGPTRRLGWAVVAGYLLVLVAMALGPGVATLPTSTWTVVGLVGLPILWRGSGRTRDWPGGLLLALVALLVVGVAWAMAAALDVQDTGISWDDTGEIAIAANAPGVIWLEAAATTIASLAAMGALVRMWRLAATLLPERVTVPTRDKTILIRAPIVTFVGVPVIALLTMQAAIELPPELFVNVSNSWTARSGANALARLVLWTASASLPLVLAGALAVVLGTRQDAQRPPLGVRMESATLVLLAVLTAALVGPPGAELAGTAVPLWILTLGAVVVLLQNGSERHDHLLDDRRSLLRQGMISRANAARLFALGPFMTWRQNAAAAAGYGTLVGLIPTALFVIQGVEDTSLEVGSTSLVTLVVGVMTQLARWAALGFLFGAAYRRLPGPHGVAKATGLALVWTAAALMADVVVRWVDPDSSGLWLFSSLQVLVYLAVIAIAYDLTTVRQSGGGLRDLGELYRVQTVRQAAGYIGTLVIAVAGLLVEAQQGSGERLTEQVLSLLNGLGK